MSSNTRTYQRKTIWEPSYTQMDVRSLASISSASDLRENRLSVVLIFGALFILTCLESKTDIFN